jgi:hypothetical protein
VSKETGETPMQTARATITKPSTTNRAKSTNDPRHLPGHSGRTPAGRRRRDLVTFFVDALGGADKVTPVQLMGIRRAAELTALAEETRAKALCDGLAAGELAALVRLEGAASRAVRVLGVKSGPAAPKVPTIGEWLAARTSRATEGAAE